MITMGEGLHLNHKVNWSDLKELMIAYADPGIELPVGPCGLIHINNKKVQLQVGHRKYLDEKICYSSDCQDSGTKVFRKHDKRKKTILCYWIFSSRNKPKDSKQIKHFLNRFTEAVYEFAETERKKVNRVINTNPNRPKFYAEVLERLIINHPELKSASEIKNDYYYPNVHLCDLFPILIEASDSATLLQFNDAEIKSVFSCLHGGQAVGNNWSFLYHHIMTVYFATNLIAAFNISPTEWGPMKESDSYFRQSLMYDCDGQTFLDSCRNYLKPEIYMKDFAAMRELCKTCFRFIYFTEMLAREIGMSWIKNHSLWTYFLEEC